MLKILEVTEAIDKKLYDAIAVIREKYKEKSFRIIENVDAAESEIVECLKLHGYKPKSITFDTNLNTFDVFYVEAPKEASDA